MTVGQLCSEAKSVVVTDNVVSRRTKCKCEIHVLCVDTGNIEGIHSNKSTFAREKGFNDILNQISGFQINDALILLAVFSVCSIRLFKFLIQSRNKQLGH